MQISLYWLILLLVMVGIPLSGGMMLDLFLTALVGIDIIILVKRRFQIEKKQATVYVTAILLLAWQLLLLVYHGSGANRIVQTMACILTFWACSLQRGQDIYRHMQRIALLLLASWAIFWLLNPQWSTFSAYFNNSNTMGAMAANLLAVFLTYPPRTKLMRAVAIGGGTFFLLISGSRSALLMIVVMVATLILVECGPKWIRHIGMSGLFYCVLIGVLAFTMVYPTLTQTELGTRLNLWSLDVFGKQFFSGREDFWGQILAVVVRRPIMGYGLGVSINSITNKDLSSHSLYLQTALQSGLVGLLLLLLLLYRIFQILQQRKHTAAYAAAAFLLGVLVHECFEVSLTQNNWPTGMFVWMLLGFAIQARWTERNPLFGMLRDCEQKVGQIMPQTKDAADNSRG